MRLATIRADERRRESLGARLMGNLGTGRHDVGMSIAALLLSVKNLYCNLQVPEDTEIMFPVLRSFE